MANARILLVEDHHDTRRLYASYLTLSGFDVTGVPSATSALGQLASGRYDAISTDLAMPGMDGAALIRQVRQSIQPAIPIIVISGQVSPNMAGPHELDCCGVFVKPCDLEQVADLLRFLVAECPRSCDVCRHLAAGSSR